VRGSRSGRPIMALLDLLGRRWALRILWELGDERRGFRELQQRCDSMSASVLSQRLAELTAAGILDSADGSYGLTLEGGRLLEPLTALDGWAKRWARR
jgi:DNA-binding HxlR family transcriptional regulator